MQIVKAENLAIIDSMLRRIGSNLRYLNHLNSFGCQLSFVPIFYSYAFSAFSLRFLPITLLYQQQPVAFELNVEDRKIPLRRNLN